MRDRRVVGGEDRLVGVHQARLARCGGGLFFLEAEFAAGEFERARSARKQLAEGDQALKHKDAPAALKAADQAERLNPGFYQNATLRGRALLALGRNAEAATAFATALAEKPAFLAEKQQLEAWLKPLPGIK